MGKAAMYATLDALNGTYAGGDFNYQKYNAKFTHLIPMNESLSFIYRVDGQVVDGAAPFWDLARIRLRGFSGGQYLDDVAATAQTELRWNAWKKLYLLGFGGAGWIADSMDDLGSANANTAGGAGFRYLLVEAQRLSIGIDLAYAPDTDETSVYFQIGDWTAN